MRRSPPNPSRSVITAAPPMSARGGGAPLRARPTSLKLKSRDTPSCPSSRSTSQGTPSTWKDARSSLFISAMVAISSSPLGQVVRAAGDDDLVACLDAGAALHRELPGRELDLERLRLE